MEKKLSIYSPDFISAISVAVEMNSLQSGSTHNQRLCGFRIITYQGL